MNSVFLKMLVALGFLMMAGCSSRHAISHGQLPQGGKEAEITNVEKHLNFNLLTQISREKKPLVFDIVDDRLEISGHLTKIPANKEWLNANPTVYRAAEGLYVIRPPHSSILRDHILWDEQTKQYALEQGDFSKIGPEPKFVFIDLNEQDKTKPWRILTVNAQTRQWHELYRSSERAKSIEQVASEDGRLITPAMTHEVRCIGMDQGKLYFYVGHRENGSILTLQPDKPASVSPFNHGKYHIYGWDAVRGQCVLMANLVDPELPRGVAVSWGSNRPPEDLPTYEVACWDIAKEQIVKFGQIKGSWLGYPMSMSTVYSPVPALQWVAKGEVKEASNSKDQILHWQHFVQRKNYIVEETLELITLDPVKAPDKVGQQ